MPAAYGNFDHIVLGPAGLFVLHSQLLRGKLHVERDGVRVRRPLADDEYAAQSIDTDRCVFLAGDRLAEWLLEQPPRCAPTHAARLAAAIDALAGQTDREAA